MRGVLYPDIALITVERTLKKLSDEKFYDDLTFHRIIKGFRIWAETRRETAPVAPATASRAEFAGKRRENDF